MANLTREALLHLTEKVGAFDYRDVLLGIIEPSIRVRITELITEENLIAPGMSRIGGLPDLPPQTMWPHWRDIALSFVGQINLADIVTVDVNNLLPHTGLLSFFYNGYQWVEGEPFESGMWKVIYSDSPSLQSVPEPSNFGEYNHMFPPCRLDFSLEMTLPPIESYYGFKHLGYTYQNGLDTRLDELFTQVYETMSADKDYYRTRLLGHPDQVQGDIFWEAEIAHRRASFRGSSQDFYDDPQSGITDWRLLFQLDSEGQAGMMWGDVGRLYYCIRQNDLEALNFDKTLCIMQCH